jgi:hypothetical protein
MSTQERTDTAHVLEQLVREADLLGAHECEFVPDGHPANPPTQAVLRAAISFGCTIGLRRAAELIEHDAKRREGAEAHSVSSEVES